MGEDTGMPGVFVGDRVSGHQDITSITNASQPQVQVSAAGEILDVRCGLPIIFYIFLSKLTLGSQPHMPERD